VRRTAKSTFYKDRPTSKTLHLLSWRTKGWHQGKKRNSVSSASHWSARGFMADTKKRAKRIESQKVQKSWREVKSFPNRRGGNVPVLRVRQSLWRGQNVCPRGGRRQSFFGREEKIAEQKKTRLMKEIGRFQTENTTASQGQPF